MATDAERIVQDGQDIIQSIRTLPSAMVQHHSFVHLYLNYDQQVIQLFYYLAERYRGQLRRDIIDDLMLDLYTIYLDTSIEISQFIRLFRLILSLRQQREKFRNINTNSENSSMEEQP